MRGLRPFQDWPKPGKDWSKKSLLCRWSFLGGALLDCFLGCLESQRSILRTLPPMEAVVWYLTACSLSQNNLGAKHWDPPNRSVLDCSEKAATGVVLSLLSDHNHKLCASVFQPVGQDRKVGCRPAYVIIATLQRDELPITWSFIRG